MCSIKFVSPYDSLYFHSHRYFFRKPTRDKELLKIAWSIRLGETPRHNAIYKGEGRVVFCGLIPPPPKYREKYNLTYKLHSYIFFFFQKLLSKFIRFIRLRTPHTGECFFRFARYLSVFGAFLVGNPTFITIKQY